MPKSTGAKKYKNSQVRHSGVILERIEGKIDLLIDQQNGMDESINAKLDYHTELLDGLRKDVNVIKLDIVVIKDNLKKKADITETTALRHRVTALEASK